MTKLNEIYKCSICGNIVEVVHTGKGELVCCGEPMELQEEKTEDEYYEKHVPVVERSGEKIVVKVGDEPHPMVEKHFIEWIEVISGGKVYRKFLNPGEEPEAEFEIAEDDVKAREYCNIHGLWVKN